MLRFIICLVSIIVVIFLAVLIERGNLLSVFSLTSFLFVVLLPALASLAVYPPKDLLRALEDIFSEKKPSSQTEEICRFYEKLFIVTGIIGTLLGAIVALSNLKTIAKLGGPLSFALLCPLYASVFYLFTRVWRARLKKGNK